MRIDHLGLKNFRGFEELEIDFEPDVNLLVGENGAGKTSIVDALTILISQALFPLFQERNHVYDPDQMDLATARRHFLHADRRVVARSIAGQIDLVPLEPNEISGRGTCGALPFSTTFTLPVPDTLSSEAPEPFLRLTEEFKQGRRTALPLVVRFPAQRRWEDPTRTFVDVPQTRLLGYRYWDRPAESQVTAVNWIRKYTFVELQEQEPVAHLAAVKRAILDAIPELEEIAFNIRHEELRFVFTEPAGRVIAYPHLSDGLRSLAAMVTDLAWRTVVLNPQLEERAPAETEGVVLIDEIEQHLHPKWQRRFLGALHQAFPRLQIIATTHSPQVIASAKYQWVRKLTSESTPERVRRAAGLDANSILEEIMGVPERPQETADALARLARLIHEEQTHEAWRLHDQLAGELGEDDTELVQARWALEMDGAPRP